MYGCNNILGCLNVTAIKSNDSLNANISLLNGLEASCNIASKNINVAVNKCSGDFISKAFKVGEDIKVSCSVVCSVSNDFYLDVSNDIVWLTPEMIEGEFDIYSNVIWKIV